MLEEVLNIGVQTKAEFSASQFIDEVKIPDEQLVRMVLDGDESAFEIIFDSYKHPVSRAVGRFFRERAEVEEFVQQSFTKAYFSLKKFRGGEDHSFAAWITRIAINVCYDEFRRRQRKAENLFSEMSDDENDYLETLADGRAVSAESSMMSSQLAEKVLAGLDAEDRIAMTLVYSENYTLDEVAGAIGITTSSLKSRLFRCRNQLKSKFGYLFQ